MGSNRKTTRVIVYRDFADKLKAKFPEVRNADLFQIMYDTSALKLESGLRSVIGINDVRKKKRR